LFEKTFNFSGTIKEWTKNLLKTIECEGGKLHFSNNDENDFKKFEATTKKLEISGFIKDNGKGPFGINRVVLKIKIKLHKKNEKGVEEKDEDGEEIVDEEKLAEEFISHLRLHSLKGGG
jgi:hypothetical protein